MTVVSQSLDLYESMMESNPERAQEKLALAREKSGQAVDLMREFSGELRGVETSDGLRIALENLMRISVPDGVECEVLFEGEEEHLPEYVRDQLLHDPPGRGAQRRGPLRQRPDRCGGENYPEGGHSNHP